MLGPDVFKEHKTLAGNMLVIQFYYVASLFFKDFANSFWLIFIIFWKVRSSYFQIPTFSAGA